MTDKLNLEEELMDKFVYVEAQITSGSNSSSKTILYWGTYKGIYELGDQEVIVLENGEHYNGSGVYWHDDSSCSKIRSKKTLIKLKDMISIDLEGEVVIPEKKLTPPNS